MSSDATPSSELEHWSALCLQWFRDGSDPAAQAALNFFEYGGQGGDVGPTAPGGLDSLLRAAGLVDANNRPIKLDPDRHAAYVSARNAARAEAHRQLLAKRQARLAELLAQYAPLESVSGSPPPLASPRPEDARSIVTNFVSAHGGSIGVHPFLKGLRRLLQQQLGEPMALRWVLAENVLLEAGDDRFMEGAVQVCGALLQRRGGGSGAGDVEAGAATNPADLVLEVVASTSDRRIQRVLGLLPADGRLEGNPTGEVSKTSIARTNVNGEQDGERDCFAAIFSCEIL